MKTLYMLVVIAEPLILSYNKANQITVQLLRNLIRVNVTPQYRELFSTKDHSTWQL